MPQDPGNLSLSKNKTILLVATLMAGGFITILNQTLLTAALPSIMLDFNISASQGQWLSTAFMLINGIMIPITAFFINTFTNRRLFIGAMSIFTCGTILAAFAPSFQILLLARVVQAVGAGVIMPMMQTIMLYVFPKERRGFAMGIMGIAIGLAPAIGPTLSGFLVDTLSWHALFYVVAPVACLIIILAFFIMRNITKQTHPPLDIPSVILSTLGFGSVLYGFSEAGNLGWGAPMCYGTILFGLMVLFFFVRRQLKLDEPLLEFTVFRSKSFTVGTILAMFMFALMISAEIQLPIYIQTARGYSALTSGLILLPGAIAVGLMSPITGKMFDRLGPRFLAIVGIAITTVGSFWMSGLSMTTSLPILTAIYAFRMLGISMVAMPMTTWAVNGLSNDHLAHGTAVNNTFRQVAASMATALLITIMSNVSKAQMAEGAEPALAMIHGMNAALMTSSLTALGLLIFALVFVHDYEGISARSKNSAIKAKSQG